MVTLRRLDRAPRLQGGVRAGPAGGGARDVLARGPAAPAASGTGRRRAVRRPQPRPCGRPRSRTRTRTGAAGSPGDRATAAAGGGAPRRARLPRGARPLHARGPRPRERDRPPRRPDAAPDRGGGRARRRGRRRTPRAAPPTPRRCSSWRACSRAAPRARRWCSPRRDGSTLGEVGATRLAEELGAPVPGGRGAGDVRPGLAPTRRGSFLQAWSNDSRRAGIGLQRTVADSIRQELGPVGRRSSGAFGQLARLSFPIGMGAQGAAARARLRRGPDLRQRRAPAAGQRPARRRSTRTAWARSAARRCARSRRWTRAAGPSDGPETLRAGREPGGARLGARPARRRAAPARARRERGRLRPGAAPAGGRSLPWVALAGRVGGGLARCALAMAELLALGGRHAGPAARADAPGRHARSTAPALAVLGGVAAAAVGGCAAWPAGSLVRPEPALADPTDPGAGVALALALALAAAVLLWLLNPYSALLAVPAAAPLDARGAHAARRRRGGPGRSLVALGALPAAARLGLLPVRPLARPAREPPGTCCCW